MTIILHESIGIPACFSSGARLAPDDELVGPMTRPSASPQSLTMTAYRTKIAGQCRLVTITWCKNMMLHGLSVSVHGINHQTDHYHCKVELKPWYFWRKQGSKQFVVDGKEVGVAWDLKSAKFNGEVEPQSDYYVAIVSEDEVVLVIGDLKKDAFRKTGCRPALANAVMVSRKEHVFGKKRFCTRVKLHERGKKHEISMECSGNSQDIEMNIWVDGQLGAQVKHLQWKFRGNLTLEINREKVDLYWDVHDWLFGSGLRHAMFLLKPILNLQSTTTEEGGDWGKLSEFCLFLYAWKVE